MIRINLLPYRSARKKENVRKQISIYLLSLLLLFVVLFVVNFQKNEKIKSLNNSIASSRNELAKLNKKAREVDEIRKQLNALNSKLKIIDSLKNGRKFGINILKELTLVVVPERMWVNSVNIDRKIIHFNGYALDDKTVADFMTNLDKSAYFKNVDLKGIVKASIKKTEVRKFTINADVNEQKEVLDKK